MGEPSAKRSRFSPESVDSLISSLERLKVNNPKAVKSNDHIYSVSGQASGSQSHDDVDGNAVNGSSHQVGQRYIRSWKMSEHLYRRKDCPFPTLARGLFTAAEDYGIPSRTPPGKGKEKVRIVARGYDKFFNIGEVDWTEVSGELYCTIPVGTS
jgi:tRNA ligase